MIIDFTIEDLLLDSYLQKNFHTPVKVIPYDLLVITIKFQSLRTYMPSAQNDYGL